MTSGTLFEEISDTIGKKKTLQHKESPYTLGFLTMFRGTIFFFFVGIIKSDGFMFSMESLPTFSLRVVLEIVQLYVSVFAIMKADRSTFSFVRLSTIPLLLLIDILLGYHIGVCPLIGMGITIVSLIAIFTRKEFNKKGLGFVVFGAINAAFTISLFKYNITHYNSIAAEQGIINLILLIVFACLAKIKSKENVFGFLIKPIFLFQSLSMGVGSILESFAYGLAPASIISAAKRSTAVMWSIIAGKAYFKEKYIILKIILFIALVIGLILLGK